MENIATTTTFGSSVVDRGWTVGHAGEQGLVSQLKSVATTATDPNYIADPSTVAAAGVMDAGRPGRPPRGEPR